MIRSLSPEEVDWTRLDGLTNRTVLQTHARIESTARTQRTSHRF
jgi:hypothetical protein